jgi:hypothetical protein
LYAETKEIGTLRAHEIKMAFFTANTLTEMCRKLVSHYFLLTRDDLELWDSDPESFGKCFVCIGIPVKLLWGPLNLNNKLRKILSGGKI